MTRTSARLANKVKDKEEETVAPPSKTIKKAPVKKKAGAPKEKTEKASASVANSFYELTAEDISGKEVKFSDYTDKVVLVVNVASRCGHTKSNYSQLEPLYKKYKSKGLEVLAFPCGQFGSQELATNEAICEFVKKYDIKVKGPDAHPVYKFLKDKLPEDTVKWNFGKYLIDKKGEPHKFYESKVKPVDMEDEIKDLLDA